MRLHLKLAQFVTIIATLLWLGNTSDTFAQEFVPTGAFLGEYSNNQDLTNFSFTRTDPEINFDWRGGSPDPSISVDTFSVRWRGNFILEEGRYEFTTRADEGIRLYVDNRLILDRWQNNLPTSKVSENLTAGAHQIKVEYNEAFNDASVQVSWARVGPILINEPTQVPTNVPTPTTTPVVTPEVMDTGTNDKLPETGTSDKDYLLAAIIMIPAICGLYLYTSFKLIN